jgi:hypothetical protein
MRQERRHAVVDFRGEIVGLSDDHGAGLEAFASLAVFPLIPKPSCGQHRRSVAGGEVPRLLAIGRVLDGRQSPGTPKPSVLKAPVSPAGAFPFLWWGLVLGYQDFVISRSDRGTVSELS